MKKDSLVIPMPSELFAPAESSFFDGVYDPGEFSFGPETYRALEPLTWNAVVSNVGGALLVTGSITGAVVTECARCLGEAQFSVNGELEGYFIIPGEGEEPEDMDEDEFDILPDNHEIDFRPILYAAMLVDLPLVPLCAEDCKGMCTSCGKNLNEGPCECQPVEEEESDIPANNPFAAALKDFKFE